MSAAEIRIVATEDLTSCHMFFSVLCVSVGMMCAGFALQNLPFDLEWLIVFI